MDEYSYSNARQSPTLEDINWFDIKNYKVLEELTYGELFNEMAYRVNVLAESINDNGQIYPTDEWLSVLNGKPLVTKLHKTQNIDWGLLPINENKCCGNSFSAGVRLALPSEISTYDYYLSNDHYVINVSNDACFNYWMEAIDNLMCTVCNIKFREALDLFTNSKVKVPLPRLSQLCTECQEEIVPNQYFSSLLTKVPDEEIEKSCDVCHLPHINTAYSEEIDTTLVSIDLKNKSDEQLIDDFKAQIGKIRKLSGIPAPKKPTRPKQANKYFEDIFNKKIIPLLDLMTWEIWCASFNNCEQTDENRPLLLQNTILNLLYPAELYVDSPQPKWVHATKKLLSKTYLDIDILNNHLSILREDKEFASRQLRN